MTIQEQINQVKSETARELLQNLHDAYMEALMIPDNLIPERYHDGRTKRQSLAKIDKKYEKFNRKEIKKQQREERILLMMAKYQSEEKHWHSTEYGDTLELADGLAEHAAKLFN